MGSEAQRLDSEAMRARDIIVKYTIYCSGNELNSEKPPRRI